MRAASLQLAMTTRGSHTARALLARPDYKLTLLGDPRLASQGIIHTIKFTNHDWHKLVKA